MVRHVPRPREFSTCLILEETVRAVRNKDELVSLVGRCFRRRFDL